MSGLLQWAEDECKIACKRENPDFNFEKDGEFDYGCACYKSALKAFKSLLEDEHSMYSFGVTKGILQRLMDMQPLTPITDEDFFMYADKLGTEGYPIESEEYLKEQGLKSHLQCPRMYSLFRKETLDGKITYHDNDRGYFINIEEPDDTYSSNMNFLDEMFPIKMPYSPTTEKYRIYAQTFLTDPENGDFDTKGILYMITPDNKHIELNLFYAEKNGKFVQISSDEYNERIKRRVDKLNMKTAERLIWNLIENSSSDDECARRKKLFENLDENMHLHILNELCGLCEFFENPDNYKYNTFSVCQKLCRKEWLDSYPDELKKIGEFLQNVLKILNDGEKSQDI